MKFKNSNGYGVLAALAAGTFIFMLLRRRLRWGFLFLNLLIAAGEKWRENRQLGRVRSLLDQGE